MARMIVPVHIQIKNDGIAIGSPMNGVAIEVKGRDIKSVAMGVLMDLAISRNISKVSKLAPKLHIELDQCPERCFLSF